MILALGGPAPAEEATVPRAAPFQAPPPAAALGMAERQRELQELRRRLFALKARYAETKKKEADLKAALESAELALEIRTAERRMLELRTAEAEKAAASVETERDSSQREVASLQKDLEARVAALYKMGRIGYLRTLAAAETGRTLLRGLQVLSFLARRDADLLSAYRKSLSTLETRTTELRSKRQELAALAAESRQKEAELAAARKEQASLLSRVHRTGEAERAEVAKLEDKSSRLAALLDLLESRGKALPAGATSIRSYRGVLDWPAKGRVVVPFGRIANPRFPSTYLRSSGWTVDVPPQTAVRAIFAGEVVFAQWLRGYGNLVVVDHGDGVFSLYGRLQTGTAARGQHVALGDVVGRLGESVEEEIPGLYFEIRDSRASVDPRIWLR